MEEVALTQTAPAGRRARPALPHDAARRLVRAAASGDRRARERVVEAYRPLIARIAQARNAGLPASVDADDLISCGLIALDRSIDRYDGGAVDFEMFALIRVRGAITDHLRELDWAPRRLRADARRLHGIERDFAATHGREPTDHEVAGLAGFSASRVDAIRNELLSAQVLSLNLQLTARNSPDGAELQDAIADDSADDPCVAALRECEAQRIRHAIDRLGERDREIFRQAVLNGVPGTRVARAHGITEGRVSQILRRVREQLARSLAEPAIG